MKAQAIRPLLVAAFVMFPLMPGPGSRLLVSPPPGLKAAGGQSTAPPAADVIATVDRVLGRAQHPGLTWGAISDVVPVLRPLYDAEPDRLLWFDGTTPIPAVEATMAAIAGVGDHGLHPEDYDATPLAEQWAAIKLGSSGPERAHFDLGVSVNVARLIAAVHFGRVDPATMQWGYPVSSRSLDIGGQFREARQGRGLAATLDALEPSFAHYTRAKKALADYKTAAFDGEPEIVPSLPIGRTKVEPGQTWAGVPQLAGRLRALGDLPPNAALASPTSYSGVLVDAVKRFQSRHVLEPDGIIGAGTIKAVNVTLTARVRQIELAMERMRWLPRLSDRPNIFVNVPMFRLWASDPVTGQEPLRMNIVVGKALNHRTPMFVERLEYVVFRPYWNPPYSITVKEIIPRIRRDPSYFGKESLEIVASAANDAAALAPTNENLAAVAAGRLFIRQKPGPTNSLGLAKFIFPNDDNVYMHGTPALQLFSRARRDFSHGCIRLEDPTRFAEWVLRDDPSWNRQRIEAAMQGQRPMQVNLRQPITVVIFYDTVHVNSEGVVNFAEDIYLHDKALDAAIEQGYPYPVK